VRAPDTVVSLHVSFINAGAELIETNTFGANRAKLASRYLEDEVVRINEAGVKLARDARQVSGREVFIAGSIGPLGEHEETWPEDRAPLFAEQAQLLAGRGVDLFLVETFFDLDELVTAIEAVRSVSDLPIVAMMTFGDDAETIGGVSATKAAERLAGLEVAAIGTNHGAGPNAALTALQAMGDALPLAAMPNIGLASMSGSRIVYPHSTPEYFAEFAAQARSLGAKLIGGCCGTTPVEIGAIAGAIAENRAPRLPSSSGNCPSKSSGSTTRHASPPTCGRAGSSPRSRSTRRSGRTTRACSRSQPPSTAAVHTWTSTTTRLRASACIR
jgi:homocysteine S-methyltransferase